MNEQYSHVEKSKDVLSPQNELLSVINHLELPLSYELRTLLEDPATDYRYGDPLLGLSGKMMRALTRFGGNTPEARRTVLGIDSETAYMDICDYLESSGIKPRSFKEHLLADLELAEVLQHPDLFYNFEGMKEQIVFSTESAEAVWDLYTQAIYPTTLMDQESFQFSDEKKMWGNCKDSEFYLAASMDSKHREQNGARSVVYVNHQGVPTFYQKGGRYNITDKPEFSNRTAINLQPVCVNGILLPRGTLVGINNGIPLDADFDVEDHIVSVESIGGIMPLRLSLFGLPISERSLAIPKHWQDFQRMSETSLGQRSDLDSFIDFSQKLVDVMYSG